MGYFSWTVINLHKTVLKILFCFTNFKYSIFEVCKTKLDICAINNSSNLLINITVSFSNE